MIHSADEAIRAVRATQIEHGIGDDGNLNEVIGFIEKTAEQETPRWETPKQYRKRTGKQLPDNGAVYVIYVRNHREFWYPRSLEFVKKVGMSLKSVIVATEAGPPPDDWRPE